MKTHFKLILTLLILFCFTLPVKAEEHAFSVGYASDDKVEIVESFDYYSQAEYFFRTGMRDYRNPVLFSGDEVSDMAYGTVSFADGEHWYYSVSRNTSSKIAGSCDALYLYRSGDRVYFMISGDIGYIPFDDVTLHPYDGGSFAPSFYCLKNGELHHAIMNTRNGYYGRDLVLDEPEDLALKEGERYYSYDGIYFYDDFYLLSDDAASGIHENAVDPDSAYYAYFMYLPYRSLSSYSGDELNAFLDSLYTGRLDHYSDLNGDGANDQLALSQLYNQGKSFAESQSEYGVNALMLLAEACSESKMGKNVASYMNNSLYDHIAFDSEEERNNDRYSSLTDGIASYAQYYASGRFTNFRSSSFSGTCFGNKLTGINASYFSDPYAGEEAASFAFRIDRELGGRDNRRFALAVLKRNAGIYDLQEEDLLYRARKISDYTLTVVEEREDSYVVIPDRLADEGIVYKKDVLFLINEDGINNEQIASSPPVTGKDSEEPENNDISVTIEGTVYLTDNCFDIRDLKINSGSLRVSSDMFEYFDEETMKLTLNVEGNRTDVSVERRESNSLPSFSEIRNMDKGEGRYHLSSTIENASVSGLRRLGSSLKYSFDTCSIRIRELGNGSMADYDLYSGFYGLNLMQGISIDARVNMRKIEFSSPLVIQVPLTDNDPSLIYTVYHPDSEEGMVKIRCQRSADMLNFIASEDGDYLIYSLDSPNSYALDNVSENITMENADPDSTMIILYGMTLLVLSVVGIILIVMYQLTLRRIEKQWKDSRNLLVAPVSVREEKPKNS